MRIALVVTGLQLGGAETQVADLTRGFLSRGHDVTLISLTGDCAIRLPDDARFRLIELRAAKSPVSLMRALWRLAGHLRRIRPDVVHSHMVHANLMTRLARLLTPLPALICSAHSRNEGGRHWMLAYRLTDRLADVTTNVSDDAVAAFVAAHAAPARRIVAMPNGIDTGRFRPDDGARQRLRATLGVTDVTPVALATGRLVPAKDYPTLLRAFARVRGARPAARLFIAGAGTLHDTLDAQIDTLGLRAAVTLLGRRDDIPGLLCAADVFVMSSAWEGLPLVIGEAMAAGLPIASTDCGGVRELVGETASAGLVPIGDDAALAGAIEAGLALDRQARAQIASANRARIDAHYSLEAIVARWLACYDRVLQRHPPAP
ncbi:N-acetyl-alpha-D-glucosaminyl L-malate synthase [Pandoraea terrae]|uniref:N-acetyl-alpha-D-glucosaminyl L-malate synthase n=1 Tax=Pandoraea terrae TaxID=1537710 RepID=A0A5E4TP83_9BURK|nr:glycosyltransferase [Pandoraea terrae]VVD89072.1 N-acetyl-alpha-D-glucosaminyl L-malate synthase [Pandoraea terrae]